MEYREWEKTVYQVDQEETDITGEKSNRLLQNVPLPDL